ncbi:hypothetical protein NWP21_08245 [Anabaenopsis sp. FSS-46]|uniref:hypothetical protein n=1 Tax=Anabaenopsis sp. FSS-46 TaxID=2971766 RepID=UPI002475878A|nr:hypothetical protein [Anabaenopsis sp. FSS-46]MDH6098830.1 hypothetical protein [Anabaenopsis sp. FSS-46]
MVNITIQNLEVESTALNQVSPGEMEKVVGGFVNIGPFTNIVNEYIRASLVGVFADALFFLLGVAP